jgi:hypothetical protein
VQHVVIANAPRQACGFDDINPLAHRLRSLTEQLLGTTSWVAAAPLAFKLYAASHDYYDRHGPCPGHACAEGWLDEVACKRMGFSSTTPLGGHDLLDISVDHPQHGEKGTDVAKHLSSGMRHTVKPVDARMAALHQRWSSVQVWKAASLLSDTIHHTTHLIFSDGQMWDATRARFLLQEQALAADAVIAAYKATPALVTTLGCSSGVGRAHNTGQLCAATLVRLMPSGDVVVHIVNARMKGGYDSHLPGGGYHGCGSRYALISKGLLTPHGHWRMRAACAYFLRPSERAAMGLTWKSVDSFLQMPFGETPSLPGHATPELWDQWQATFANLQSCWSDSPMGTLCDSLVSLTRAAHTADLVVWTP